MLGKVLSRVDTTMLTTSTTEREHQRRKATLDVSAHMGIGQFIDRIEEGEYLTIVLQESDNRLVKSCEFLVGFVSARVVGASAVEDIATTIATLILGYALTIGETIDLYHQRRGKDYIQSTYRYSQYREGPYQGQDEPVRKTQSTYKKRCP